MSDHTCGPSEQPGHHANLEWDEQGQPIASHFGDFYFSRANGLEETRYVFLQHNQLPQRWHQLTAFETFYIAETGFGTGLNFLASWQSWQQGKAAGQIHADAQLHFISVEKFPLQRSDLIKVLDLWPELNELTAQLIAAYPPLTQQGFHRLDFGDVILTLIIDDAAHGLEQLLQSDHPALCKTPWQVDAWFFDGFTPSKNPSMWQPELFQLLQQLSGLHTTYATFTAAGIVRRGLEAAGFSVNTMPGFGRKREMICGQLLQPAELPTLDSFDTSTHNSSYSVPWYISQSQAVESRSSGKNVLVIGAGIAGCHTANALAKRGWQVTELEENTAIASEASGNPQGVLYAKLSHREETLGDFNLAALMFAQRAYTPLWQSGDEQNSAPYGQACGVMQLGYNDKSAKLQQQLHERYAEQTQQLFQWISPQEAEQISGLPQNKPALFFPASGWLSPAAVCQALLQHPAIACHTNHKVTQLQYDASNKSWKIEVNGKPYTESFSHIVIANANRAKALIPSQHLPLKPIRGQVSYIDASKESKALKTVLCAEGYIGPANPSTGQHCLGASFNPHTLDLDLSAEEHNENMARLQQQFPSLADTLKVPDKTTGRVALRCTTPDYLPLVGPCPHYDNYLEDFALLRKNAKAGLPNTGRNWPNLYINVGHGSRGLAYTPLCAELLASHINHEPSPLPRALTTALHPGRFIIRGLIRKQL